MYSDSVNMMSFDRLLDPERHQNWDGNRNGGKDTLKRTSVILETQAWKKLKRNKKSRVNKEQVGMETSLIFYKGPT